MPQGALVPSASVPIEYRVSLGATSCTNCPSGTYTDQDLIRSAIPGAHFCSSCSAGEFLMTMNTPGITLDGARPCTACSLCSAQLSTTRVGCNSALAYAGFCSACGLGKYSKFLGEAREECTSCVAGTYQSMATRGRDTAPAGEYMEV
jgi:hypothetical protein